MSLSPANLVSLKSTLLDCGSKNTATSTNASQVIDGIITTVISSQSVCHAPFIINTLLGGLERNTHFNVKTIALNSLEKLIDTFQHEKLLYTLVPQMIEGVYSTLTDVKRNVAEKGKEVMVKVCALINNRDISGVIPAVIESIMNHNEVQECIHKLASTTFVQAVEAPALSLLVPLLLRGLRERVTAIKRKSALIIENMSKLVEDPTEAKVFLPRLLPELEKVANEVADPECRNVVSRTMRLLQTLQDECTLSSTTNELNFNDQIKQHLTTHNGDEAIISYINDITKVILANNADLALCFGDEPTSAITMYIEACQQVSTTHQTRNNKTSEEQEEDEGEGEAICNCEFSLAYGAKILLNNARLNLKRGKRYGLCGPNGVGKSTLMRAIDNGQVDGFPSKTDVCTVYVEHDIDGSEAETLVLDFILNNTQLQDIYAQRNDTQSLTQEFVANTLTNFGFSAEMQASPLCSLSGGWKMKLALARAVLMKADILLLDEPTNHLDVVNVAWLVDYLNNAHNVSCVIVSHDSGFLDNVCTHIIHYESRKLKNYRGNLSKFVERVPAAQSYYALEATQFKFTFPEPGFLEGVKTKDKAILKMDKVGFTYPGTERKIIDNASLYCSLNSRIGCIGPNGAGKSTLIKMLTGETEPTSGTVWKHPNLRIAYVAQHAFHHIESHLDKTPAEYIQWRFAPGEDREAQHKETRKINDEEESAMKAAKTLAPDGIQRKIEKILARRKLKKDYEYEIEWVGLPIDQTSWLPRHVLEDMGFSKMVNEIDIKEAAAQGLLARPLTTLNVQKHLEDLGLEAEFGTHSRIRGLSGGQKVKVVLAAATWQQPHIIVLDEPTNYLDRDSLGALAQAIKDFGGGIVVISHNGEFIRNVAIETWTVGGGKVDVFNPNANTQMPREKVEIKAQEDVTDAFGNTIKVSGPKKKLSNKEKKARDKMRKARRERGEVVSESEEEY
jgi:elongation factor 3